MSLRYFYCTDWYEISTPQYSGLQNIAMSVKMQLCTHSTIVFWASTMCWLKRNECTVFIIKKDEKQYYIIKSMVFYMYILNVYSVIGKTSSRKSWAYIQTEKDVGRKS